jgi:pyridoxal phosphate enzyme (YggS family)
MNEIADNLSVLLQRLDQACARAGRKAGAARLIAVSKGFPAANIAAVAAAGQRAFGESYVQEAQVKMQALGDAALDWHFIGPVQGNKTREISGNFAWVHSVERLKIAQRLSLHRPAAMPPLNVCVQVNISGEASKSGCAPQEAAGLCAAVAALPRLRLRGLMAIPAPVPEAQAARAAFHAVRTLFGQIRAAGAVDPADFDTLSMGMSDDFEVAAEEGATLVRVGTAIFGRREARGERRTNQ